MTQLVTTQQKIANVRGLLERSRSQMAQALPRHMSADRMLRITMTSVQRTPALLDCDPRSLIGAVIQASQLGLEPDGVLGQAYLIPFGKQVTFIPGYRGLLALARRSGQISTIEARAVHAADHFVYAFGLKPVLEHRPAGDGDPGELVAVYAVAHLKDGGWQFEVMLRREVEAIRTRSRAGTSGPWVTDYEEMAKKTVLRRLCKLLPASVELATAVALDERADAGISQDLDVLADEPGEPVRAAGKLEALTAALKTEEGGAPTVDAASSPVGAAGPEATAAPSSAPAPDLAQSERTALVRIVADARAVLGDKVVADLLKQHNVRVADLGTTDPAALAELARALVAAMEQKKTAGAR